MSDQSSNKSPAANPQADQDAYKFFGTGAKKYGEQYTSSDLGKLYPEHVFRLNIFLELLKQISPKRMLDVGCGSGEPLLSFLRAGHDAHGFDYSPEMVEQAGQLLQSNNFEKGRVSRNNMENIEGIQPGQYDCVVGLGSLYYSRKFESTIRQIVDVLPKGGSLIFSLRNELFSLFSLNSYTANFFMKNFVPGAALTPGLNDRLDTFLDKKFQSMGAAKKFLTIDDQKVYSLYHNPLTVEREVLAPAGLSLKGTYYYHYHALPPEFEHSDTLEFRKLSCEMENPTDWRGMFMSSSFVVHAVKN
jgi:SAM-dependent methyltransferase